MNTKYKMYFSYNNTNNPIIEYYDTEEEAYESGRKYLKEYYNAFRVEWYVKEMEEEL